MYNTFGQGLNANEMNQSLQELESFLLNQNNIYNETGFDTIFKFPWVHKNTQVI